MPHIQINQANDNTARSTTLPAAIKSSDVSIAFNPCSPVLSQTRILAISRQCGMYSFPEKQQVTLIAGGLAERLMQACAARSHRADRASRQLRDSRSGLEVRLQRQRRLLDQAKRLHVDARYLGHKPFRVLRRRD